MSFQTLQMGINALKAGNRVEGARLLRIALKGSDLSNELRAVALIALAEAVDDPQQKVELYQQAVAADPNSAEAKQRLARALMAQLSSSPPASPSPPPPPPTLPPEAPPAPPVYPARPASVSAQIVSVVGGPNGPGTAFFVTRDGLLATTRYVVGGLVQVLIELDTGRQVTAYVVRAYPELDLTFLYADERVADLLPITAYPRLPDEMPLTAIAHDGQVVRGQQRPTKRVLAPHWIPTDIVRLSDAGGNPMFDARNHLVGMLTRNSSRSSAYVFGLHIHEIRRRVELLTQEMQGGERRVYCPSCGSQSRAIGAGLYYCEVCGTLSPTAASLDRRPLPEAEAFDESTGRMRCAHCGSTAGFYEGRCLRCGQAPSAPRI